MNNTSTKGKEIKIPGPDHPIAISPAEGKVRVTVAGKVVAESTGRCNRGQLLSTFSRST
jgi:uncharacterized protein (DUF427 family)